MGNCRQEFFHYRCTSLSPVKCRLQYSTGKLLIKEEDLVGNCILYWGLRSLNLLYAGCGVLFSLQSSDFYFGMQVCTGSVFELLQIICYYFFEGIRFVVAVVCLLCVSSIVLVCYCFFIIIIFLRRS